MNNSKFRLFDEALKNAMECMPIPVFCREAAMFCHGVQNGQRFYVPYGAGVFAGKSYRDIGAMLNLPFPITCVATESIDSPDDVLEIVVVASQIEAGDPSFNFVCSIRDKLESQDWMITPTGRCQFKDDGTIDIGLVDSPLARSLLKDNPSFRPKMWHGIIGTIHSLCGMLALHNVQLDWVEPPIKLNKKRERSGTLPLYSYRVLNVGGQVWDTPGEDSGDGQGYRSHLRRGHIRRLGERHIWVRATYVHGRIAGFVDKDYNVTGALA